VKLKLAAAGTLLALLAACDRATTGPRIPVYERPQTALVIVDAQETFLAPEGVPSVAQSQVAPMLAVTNRLLREAPSLGVDVVFVTSDSPPGGAIDARVVRGAAPVFSKSRADAFSNAELDGFLRSRSIDHLVLAGVFADRCVYYTAQGAMNRGYKVKVVGDAVAAASDPRRDRALEQLRREGAEIIDGERTVAEWARRKRYLASR
jgi:nicotinamidase-related amidase